MVHQSLFFWNLEVINWDSTISEVEGTIFQSYVIHMSISDKILFNNF